MSRYGELRYGQISLAVLRGGRGAGETDSVHSELPLPTTPTATQASLASTENTPAATSPPLTPHNTTAAAEQEMSEEELYQWKFFILRVSVL